jgi:preprotein translocase subunit SecA
VLPDVLGFAIVDEVDSIQIDESRNPMIISQPSHRHTYSRAVFCYAPQVLDCAIVNEVESILNPEPYP